MPAGFEIAGEDVHPLDVMAQAEDGLRLKECLDSLEAQKREIIIQAYIHGLSREELGRRFSAPVPTIKTWLYRSLAQLKDCLAHDRFGRH